MSKLIGPEGNCESPLGTDKYYTKNTSPRQEGNLRFVKVVKGSLRFASSIGIAAASIFSPVDSPVKTTATAEDKCHEVIGVGFTPLHGDCDPNDITFGIFLDAKSGANVDMAKRLSRVGVNNLPAGFAEGISILLLNPQETGDLGCNFMKGNCDPNSLRGHVDKSNKLLKPIGKAIQEPITLAKSPYEGIDSTGAAMEGQIPLVYTGAILFLSDPPSTYNQNALDYSYARAFLHEGLGHGVAGIRDNDGDEKDAMHHMFHTLKFSDKHLQILREKLALGVQRYAAPAVEAKLLNPTTLLADQTLQSSSLGLILAVYPSIDTTQFLSEVIPYHNDGAGVADYVGTPFAIHTWGETGRKVPSPPQWYGLLPDMTYTWRVRTSHLAVPLPKEDQKWGQREIAPGVFVSVPGAEATMTFKTPKRFSEGITSVSPKPGEVVTTSIPNLIWDNRDKDVFYYEVQASKDQTFNTDPETATASVYWELRHGGVTDPQNSYSIPQKQPLELGTQYFWRVRPRIQGDGTPVAWSEVFTFSTPSSLKSASLQGSTADGWIADADFGNGIIGPSAYDMGKWRK